MKKVACLLTALLLCCFLAGCSTSSNQKLTVYSFSGQDDTFSITNGVVVIAPDTAIFYGGYLDADEEHFQQITSYSTSFYVWADGHEHTLMDMRAVDTTGTFLNLDQEVGSVSSQAFFEGAETAIRDQLFFRLETVNQNGERQTLEIPMSVVDVTQILQA